MTRFGIVLTVIAAAMTAAANLVLRKSLAQTANNGSDIQCLMKLLLFDASFVVGILLYGMAMILWLKVVSMQPVGTAYPILVGLTFVMLLLGAVFFINEPLTFKKIAGTILIIAGITIVAQA